MKIRLLYSILVLLIISACSMPEGPVPLSGEAPEAEGWDAEVLISELEHPWSVAWLPEGDNNMLITERPGRLRIVERGQLQPRTISGLPDMYVSGQGGLLDVSLHPNFEVNRRVYLTYATGDEDANRTTVGMGELHEYELQNFREIFRVSDDKSDDQHFGSRILWVSENKFLLSLADGGNYVRFDGGWIREQAQNPETHLGKVLKLTDEGEPAEDGPFLEDENALPEIWTTGHRNIQGLALDPESGRVWANEHGSRGGDELNLLKPGANYGWPEVTYSREYHYTRISDETSKPGMEDPKVVWTPAQAPSGLAFYTDSRFPDWQGDLFSGGLVGEQVRRIILDGETVTGEESITLGRRVRDVRQGPSGYLYVLTDHENGELIRIIPSY
ncbi:PQQ-dependent sugar dehydrogenase [Rhodohalobacter sp. SW132]|uniref:PQQ-dependent sugar dehydrogenase n=1 Tax=Rhodohalobacter sp. SW132 TaxID=2293433 RepID=UPI000E24C4F7|nr:PQQ-dependent sugar dehydrogenase [Rhodohalobacter sp. SW132]REL24290.1 PQQ-dependent sugar dehydrogenase [Rhodohalobacter sp. SW132]